MNVGSFNDLFGEGEEQIIIPLNDWSLVQPNPYSPEESLRGYVDEIYYKYIPGAYYSGVPITTSRIQKIFGRFVRTSNTVYELMEPEENYVTWCEDKGYDLDPAQPLKFIQG